MQLLCSAEYGTLVHGKEVRYLSKCNHSILWDLKTPKKLNTEMYICRAEFGYGPFLHVTNTRKCYNKHVCFIFSVILLVGYGAVGAQ